MEPLTLHEASAALHTGQITSLELVEQCLARIDRWEPQVRAWVFVDREGARAEARRRDEEFNKGQDRGPLHGMPIGVKDIFDVFDWPTAAGSKLWAQSVARQDAETVRRLRQAGAVFLGKTVTTQFASFDPPVTRNPWNLDRTPGGSSSGSAAALAVGMCLGALGSQTGGSITRPASFCGVCGFKPAYGAVPLQGIVPLAPSMDHPGPMARCVRDLEIMYEVIGDHFSRPLTPGLFPPQRLGVAGGLFQDRADPAARQAVQDAAARFQRGGVNVEEITLPAGFAEVLRRHRVVMAVEAATFHRMRLEKHPEDYAPRIRELLEEGLRCPASEYADCKVHQAGLREETARLLEDGTILLTPATIGPAPDVSTTGDPAFNSPWSYTGLPTVCFPSGAFVNGLPLGLQLVGHQERVAQLLAAALWCEKTLAIAPLAPKPRPQHP